MRITSNSDYLNAMGDIERAASELARWQTQVSSGRRLQVPSDDPAAAARAIAEHATIGTVDQYVRAADSVTTRLSAVDDVLSDIVSRLTAAKAATTAAVGTIATTSQREAIAGELEAASDALLSALNATFRGGYVFSGAAALSAPYEKQADGSISAYQGDHTEVALDIDASRAVPVVFDGQALAQGADGDDIFASLSRLADAVRSGDQAGITAGLEAIERTFDRAVALQTRVGNHLAALDDTRARLATLKQASQARLSKDEAANMPEAISRMARADAAYQAALGAIGAKSRLTLLDYLR